MKKRYAAAVLAAITALTLFLLTACGPFNLFSSDGKSAYDAAVTRGETGSRESWLSSLDTPTTELRRAYEEAIADGSFTGTYFEFLEALGVENTNGAYVQQSLRSVVTIFARFAPKNSREEEYYSGGSGVIYSLDREKGDALIVTNYHVVYDADSKGNEKVAHISDEITLYLYGGAVKAGAIPATFLGGAMAYDIAVLSVTDSAVLRASYAAEVVAENSDSLTVGEDVYAVGNAEGLGMSVTKGVVSVDAEYIDIYSADEKELLSMLVIRTDAAVNHGNSGGGLFNASGRLIGIVNARDETDGTVAFGYAIPANLALALAQNIIDTCAADSSARGAAQARLGLTAQTENSIGVYDPQTGKMYIEETIVVSEIDYRSAADKAGLRVGDTLVHAKLSSTRGGAAYTRDVALTRLFKLTNLLMEVRKGDTITLTVSRSGELMDVSVTFSDNSYFRSLG